MPVQSNSSYARHPADRRLARVGAAAAAVDDPLEHAHVLAEARPEKFAVVVLAEPVHVEDARRIGAVRGGCGASGRSSRPCCSRRTGAWPSGRGGPGRRRRRRRRSSRSPSSRRRYTPWIQLNAWKTSGIVVARRPPKMIALIGTPAGSCASGASDRVVRHRRGEAAVRMRGLLLGVAASTGCPASRCASPAADRRPCLPTTRRRRASARRWCRSCRARWSASRWGSICCSCRARRRSSRPRD